MSPASHLAENNLAYRTNILVVEDDVRVRSQISQYLRLRGFAVFEAASGDDALEFLGRGDAGIACVFSDVQMPGNCDGIQLARWIIENRPGVPVLLTSGSCRAEDLDPALRETLRIVPKPYRGHAVEAGIVASVERFHRRASTISTAWPKHGHGTTEQGHTPIA
ncbi:response regulator [Sphingomonas sp. Root241]|uniref:response regulator n=1 Tax=Sphingomonas sp. Root241 TaxID=1736501 RepID=UPI0009ECAD13|nr:response regulator [Sphingomonas sp. Root241]